MKSTQDGHIWLANLAAHLEAELASIEIFTDKSFRITTYTANDSVEVYNSSEEPEMMDINDLYYYPVELIVMRIKENREAKLAKPEAGAGQNNPVKFGGVEL